MAPEPTSNGATRKPKSDELLPVSRPDERAAAAARMSAYPYRFPKDRREIGACRVDVQPRLSIL